MAGLEGFEPPAYGFGDRHSTVGVTALQAVRDVEFPDESCYLVSRCKVCLRSQGQYFFNSSLPVVFFLFFRVL